VAPRYCRINELRLQAHAQEVSELARDGMVAMMRGMRSRMMSRAEGVR